MRGFATTRLLESALLDRGCNRVDGGVAQPRPRAKKEKARPAAHVSEASLLSGTAKDSVASDATGGLLKEVGESGILVMKDFTSMFTMNRDERGKALSALRHCYDGMWVRPVGSDGARKLV